MPGIVQSMFRGMYDAEDRQRLRKEQQFADEERDYQSGRRSVLDSRQDTAWSQGLEDRDYELNTARPMREESSRIALEGQRFDATRRPIIARHEDEAHSSNMAGARLNREVTSAQAGREKQRYLWDLQDHEREAPIKAKLAELQMDEVTFRQQVAEAQNGYRKAAAEFQRTNDPRVFADWYNRDIQDGNKVRFEQDKDGAWVAIPEVGEPRKVGSAEDVAMYAYALTNPDVFLESMVATRAAQREAAAAEAKARAEHPERFNKLIMAPDGTMQTVDLGNRKAAPVTDAQGGAVRGILNGRGNSVPADLQKVEAIFKRLPTIEGESDDARWMRAWDKMTRSKSTSPEAAVAGFYQALTKNLVKPDITGRVDPKAVAAAQEQAKQLTNEFAREYYPELFDRSGAEAPPAASDPAPRNSVPVGAGSTQDSFNADEFLRQF